MATYRLPGDRERFFCVHEDAGYGAWRRSASLGQVPANGEPVARQRDSPWLAAPPQASEFYVLAQGLISLLALMVVIAAGLGVLNTVLMGTRDRAHDLGVFKAIGMRPGQVLVMVVCRVVLPAVVAAVIAIPAAMALTTITMNAMAGAAHSAVPASFTQVFPLFRLASLSLAALMISLAGALLPASWAARARPAAARRSE